MAGTDDEDFFCDDDMPSALMSCYTNQEVEPIVPSPSLCGMHLQFQVQDTDMVQSWFHRRANRSSAVKLLESRPSGTFLVRPSSQRSCYALSYVRPGGVISHDIIYSLYPGFSLVEGGSNGAVYSTLARLVQACDLVDSNLYVSEEEHPEASGTEALEKTSFELVERLVEHMQANEEMLSELVWTLSVCESRPSSPADHWTFGVPATTPVRDAEKRTIINYCFSEYAAPDLMPMKGQAAACVFSALAGNRSLFGLTVRGYLSSCLSKVLIANVTDDDVLLLARALVRNQHLTSLDLTANGIGDKGATYLAAALTRNKGLKRLILTDNCIHQAGTRELAKALKANVTLDVLKLDGQTLRDSITGCRILYNDRLTKRLVGKIKYVLERKAELSRKQKQTICFRGFQKPEAVERKLQGRPRGSYIFYLQEDVACALFVAFVPLQGKASHGRSRSSPLDGRAEAARMDANSAAVVHRAVYRHIDGFCFENPEFVVREGREETGVKALPTLSSYCAWRLAAEMESRKSSLGYRLTKACQRQVDNVVNFLPLWGVHAMDDLSGRQDTPVIGGPYIYPTLTAMTNAPKRWMRPQ